MDNGKVEKLENTVQELKITTIKQEINLEQMNQILLRLTETVETHVKRSESLEELVILNRQQLEHKIQEEIKPLKSHVSFVKGALWMGGIVVGLIALLNQLGLLKF